ncbi:uncharacterized protein METZ01_LOCUS463650, partial [marine metagenome]
MTAAVMVLLGVLVLMAVACGGSEAPTDVVPAAAVHEIGLETVASDLQTPWAMAFAPDGRIFVTERPGRIRVIENGNLRA